jgi:hypothetical protein
MRPAKLVGQSNEEHTQSELGGISTPIPRNGVIKIGETFVSSLSVPDQAQVASEQSQDGGYPPRAGKHNGRLADGTGNGDAAESPGQARSPKLRRESSMLSPEVQGIITTASRFEQYLRNAHSEMSEEELMQHVESAMTDEQFREYLGWSDEMDERVIQAHRDWNWPRGDELSEPIELKDTKAKRRKPERA